MRRLGKMERLQDTAVEWMPGIVSDQVQWVQQGADGGALPSHCSLGHRPHHTYTHTLAPELLLSHGLQQQCSYCDRTLWGTFRPPQSGPSTTTSSQAPGSLPGQAGSQAQLRAWIPAASPNSCQHPITSLKRAKSTMADGGEVLSTYYVLSPPKVIYASR